MNWDIVMAIAQAVLAAFILPILWNSNSYVPRLTSGTFSLGLGAVALSLINLESPLGGAVAGVSMVLWAVVFVVRGKKRGNE